MPDRWRFYGVNRDGPGITYYQGVTDAPEDTWVVRESDCKAPCPVCAQNLSLTQQETKCPNCGERLRAGWLSHDLEAA